MTGMDELVNTNSQALQIANVFVFAESQVDLTDSIGGSSL